MQKDSSTLRKVFLKMSKYRHEYKYMIDSKQEHILRLKASGLMQLDRFAADEGGYRITSLYFDDLGNSCFYENEDGTDPRSKFRIRYYNDDREHLKLEKKSKKNGMTLKESCTITREECMQFLQGNIPAVTEDTHKMAAKLFSEMRLRKLLPKVIVSYDRIPYVYKAGNVRITFDKNLTASSDVSKFMDGSFGQRPILQKGESVLEVKWDELLPLHIKEYMHLERLQWTAFSKYYLCRKHNLNGGLK